MHGSSVTTWDETFDVIVAGYGFAGAVAATVAADAGARVLLIEKMPQPGGISVCSAGGVRFTRDAEAAFAYLQATNGDTAPEENLRALAHGMTEMEAFVRELAAASDARVSADDAPGNYPFDGYQSLGFVTIADIPGFDVAEAFPNVSGMRGGARLFRVMQDNIAKRGIEVRLNTPARRLVTGADGTNSVEGVIIGTDGANGEDGDSRAIRANHGVVLACGGFEAGDALKVQHWQGKPVLPGAVRGNTGDGIRMAQAAGAGLWHMWHYHGTYGFRHPDPAYPFGIRTTRLPDWIPDHDTSGDRVLEMFAASKNRIMPWIVVDQDGRRFMNEYPPYVQDTGHRPMELYDPVRQGYPRLPAWLIVDDDGRQSGPLGFPTYNDKDVSYKWSPDNTAEVGLGILAQADSVAEMAAAMGTPADALAETLAGWNRFCDAGDDADFGRITESMVPIRKPPYCFGAVWPIVANTQGGPVHDARQRVLDAFGAPIPGLYAAGELGSIFGHLYMAGGNLAECFVGGRIAGREAATIINTETPIVGT